MRGENSAYLLHSRRDISLMVVESDIRDSGGLLLPIFGARARIEVGTKASACRKIDIEA